VLATVWALLPALSDVKLGFPRSWITVGLAALGFLLTLFAWLDTFDGDFSIWALLGMLTATAILVFSVLALLPELRNRPALPGGLAGAAQWANQPAPGYGPQYGQPQYGPPYGQPYGQPDAPGQPAPAYGHPPQYAAPPPPPPSPPATGGPSPSYGPPPGGPPSAPPPHGGSTASGEGTSGADRSEGS
jgi:hypothetical protein